MMNNKALYIVIIVLVLVVIGGGIFLLSNKGAQKETGEGQPTTSEAPTGQATSSPSTAGQAPAVDNTMVDCSKEAAETSDPSCFLNRMSECLPVTVKMTGSDGKTEIEITILGVENEKCHFQRKINNAVDLNCYFPKGTLNMDTLDQTFGNDKGLQQVVDDACSRPGW